MMDRRSRHRLIGATVLIVSSAVVLPLLLDGERPVELETLIVIPDEPSFPVVSVSPVKPLSAISEDTVDDAHAENTSSATTHVAEIELIPRPRSAIEPSQLSKPAKSENQARIAGDGNPKSSNASQPAATTNVVMGDRWTVQIATFKNRENATRLVERLVKADYTAYIVTTNSLYKVFIGPELKRSAAEKVLVDVQKEFRLKGFVVKYAPNP